MVSISYKISSQFLISLTESYCVSVGELIKRTKYNWKSSQKTSVLDPEPVILDIRIQVHEAAISTINHQINPYFFKGFRFLLLSARI